ncbi:hypothetical protein N7452_007438 [Penicillium brevicompactum]|uniref:Uncharacterized protein n=1 Tax=Penicillium brevicompactum TaxID=5074 RepID=A0A9W9UDJ2_PENBR|nr:hypothetical protein N7452_007438 [Penicillium brevicompactum]
MGKIKWDSAADQILLTKILETSEISVDVQRVADAWPANEEDKPTPRAIKERINKIKELSKRARTGAPGAISPNTPKKRAPRKTPNSGATPARKRGRVSQAQRAKDAKLASQRAVEHYSESSENEENEDEDDSEIEEILQVNIKREKHGNDNAAKIKREDAEKGDEKFALAKMIKEDENEISVPNTIRFVTINDEQIGEMRRKVDSKKRKITEEEEEALFADPIPILSSPEQESKMDTSPDATSLNPASNEESAEAESPEWYPMGKPLLNN